MPIPPAGDFATIMEQMNQASSAAVAHPFGGPRPGVGPVGRGNGLKVRQETHVFVCPKNLAEYDEFCNRAWAGECSIRFEDRTFTKEGDLVIAICFFFNEDVPRGKPGIAVVEGDVEPPTTSHRLP